MGRVSPDFRAGYDAAAKAKQLIIDALEARVRELERALEPWWNVPCESFSLS